MKLSELRAQTKEKWFEFSPAANGKPAVEFLIAHGDSDEFQKKQNKLSFLARRRGSTVNFTETNRKAMAGTILRGWKGVQAEDGSDLQFTVHNAELALSVGAISNFVTTISDDLSNFRDGDEELPKEDDKSGIEKLSEVAAEVRSQAS
jgi:hypothetical protein